MLVAARHEDWETDKSIVCVVVEVMMVVAREGGAPCYIVVAKRRSM